MIIDCHGHYTTAPKELEAYRQKQIADLKEPSHARAKGTLSISDDQRDRVRKPRPARPARLHTARSEGGAHRGPRPSCPTRSSTSGGARRR